MSRKPSGDTRTGDGRHVLSNSTRGAAATPEARPAPRSPQTMATGVQIILKEYAGARRLGPCRLTGPRTNRIGVLWLLEAEHEHQGLIYGAELVRVEAPGG